MLSLLHYLVTYRATKPDRIHPQVLRDMVEVLTERLPTTDQQSWLIGDVSGHSTLANVNAIYKKV